MPPFPPVTDADLPGVAVTSTSTVRLVELDLDDRYETNRFQKSNSAHWVAPRRMRVFYRLGSDGWTIGEIVLIGYQTTHAFLVFGGAPDEPPPPVEEQRTYNETNAPTWAVTIARGLLPRTATPAPLPALGSCSVLLFDRDAPQPSQPLEVTLPGVPRVGDWFAVGGQSKYVVAVTWVPAATIAVHVDISITPPRP
jgi:hypothetical protein